MPGQDVPLGLELEWFNWRKACVLEKYEGGFQDFLLVPASHSDGSSMLSFVLTRN